jgi:hypothetical protein
MNTVSFKAYINNAPTFSSIYLPFFYTFVKQERFQIQGSVLTVRERKASENLRTINIFVIIHSTKKVTLTKLHIIVPPFTIHYF